MSGQVLITWLIRIGVVLLVIIVLLFLAPYVTNPLIP